MTSAERDNLTVWDGRRRGHYEVYYLKVNDPTTRRAFWLRYTLTSPVAGSGQPVAELWAIAFQPGATRHRAWKRTFPIAEAGFGRDRFECRIGGAVLSNSRATGALGTPATDGIEWDLSWEPAASSFHHFPWRLLYRLPLPKTKVMAPNLSVRMTGSITVDGERLTLVSAPGHQAHIWGGKHAARWAWANCNAFADDPDAVVEALTAQIPLGTRLSPPLSILYVRAGGQDYVFNRLSEWIRLPSTYDLGRWQLSGRRGGVRVEVEVTSRTEDMVGVRYRDPDGEGRVCHNTKLASVRVAVTDSRGSTRVLSSQGACAYEVVEREGDPRVPVLI